MKTDNRVTTSTSGVQISSIVWLLLTIVGALFFCRMEAAASMQSWWTRRSVLPFITKSPSISSSTTNTRTRATTTTTYPQLNLKQNRQIRSHSSSSFLISSSSKSIRRSRVVLGSSPNYNLGGNDNIALVSSTNINSSVPLQTGNAALVQARLAASAAKRESRRKSTEETRRRNLELRSVLSNPNTTTATTTQKQQQQHNNNDNNTISVAPMYAVKVSVCPILREELKLNGRERRGRMFIEEQNTAATQTLAGLKFQLHAFFRCLRKSTYTLKASLPIVAQDGSIQSPADITIDHNEPYNDNDNNTTSAFSSFWPIASDDDVLRTFEVAHEYFHNSNNNQTILKRPTLFVHVEKDPNAPLPPPPPPYLENIADPAISPSMTMLSFYSFPPGGIGDPEEFGQMIRKTWNKHFAALGRVYVATEGVNAQMAVPTNVIENFMECCKLIPELGEHMENGINIDPIPLTMEQFQVAGDMDGKPAPPFRNLHVRVRSQIVADGLDEPLNWQHAGYDMPPMEWHKKIQDASSSSSSSSPLILDCRNSYETAVGQFEGAEPLNTENFRDSWSVLEEKLADKPKDAPIMTYCTGGIRCVKVGAYLTQKLGFTNVSRLAGGIIAYDRTLHQTNETIDKTSPSSSSSLFRGTNYVFDGRVGRQITNHELGQCITCGTRARLVGNCRNGNCHKRMVQCEKCRSLFYGTCSDACRQRVLLTDLANNNNNKNYDGDDDNNNNNSAMMPRRRQQQQQRSETDQDISAQISGEISQETKEQSSSSSSYQTLDDYATDHSSSAPPLYQEIERNTAHYLPTGSHMVSGSSQGRLLKLLASMTKYGRILELGTFSGYATACLVEGAASSSFLDDDDNDDKVLGNRWKGSYVLSLERDSKAFDLAAFHMKIMSKFGIEDDAAKEASKLRPIMNGEEEEEDSDDSDGTQLIETEEDSISIIYKNTVTCELLRVSDALATVEAMARGDDLSKNTQQQEQQEQQQQQKRQPFDMVFIDADKTRLLDYLEACIGNDQLLKKGGLIVVDNVLWKGLVLLNDKHKNNNVMEEDEEKDDDDDEEYSRRRGSIEEVRKSRRARKLAGIMHRFNTAVVKDDRIEVVVLPMRDGLSVIRKKKNI